MTFQDKKRILFLSLLVTYVITGNPVFGLIVWLILAYEDFLSFAYYRAGRGKNNKILKVLYFLSIGSSLSVGIDVLFDTGIWALFVIRLILVLITWFFESSDDDWDDKLDKLKDSAKSVFWMGRWRSATAVSLA